jgi:hypothetical protein
MLPTFNLSSFHDYTPETDVYVIVDQGSYNIDGMLDVDVVSNIC